MLFRQNVLQGIRNGTITMAFRRWRRPTVKSGGTLLTPVGQLHIASVSEIDPKDISSVDARRAGYASREAALAELDKSDRGALYRIELGALEADPRVALREARTKNAQEHAALRERLGRLDARATNGPWTRRTLSAIQAQPGVRAADLCLLVGEDKLPFKANVRKLKAMGLTESLETGYRLSPRGDAFLRDLERADNDV